MSVCLSVCLFVCLSVFAFRIAQPGGRDCPRLVRGNDTRCESWHTGRGDVRHVGSIDRNSIGTMMMCPTIAGDDRAPSCAKTWFGIWIIIYYLFFVGQMDESEKVDVAQMMASLLAVSAVLLFVRQANNDNSDNQLL